MSSKRMIEEAVFLLLIAVLVLSLSVKPRITGMAIGDSDKIEDSVIEGLQDNDSVDVIIILKTPEISNGMDGTGSDKELLEEKKNEIDDIQDNVLSSIDYVEADDADEQTIIDDVDDKEKTEETDSEMIEESPDDMEDIESITGSAVSETTDAQPPEFELENRYETINAISGKISSAGLEKLKDNPDVERIITVKQRKIILDESVPLINATAVHSMQVDGVDITGLGQTICIIDTGIDYNHADLGGGWGSKVIGGYDFVNGDTDPIDDNGHGTHVAGIAAADGALIGVAPDADIIAIKACDDEGVCDTNNIIAGIDWCINNASIYNISVITMSLGGGGPYNSYCNGIDEAQAINDSVRNGIIVTIASGNSAWNNGIAAPACVQNATSVGSSDDGSDGTSADEISGFSNTGSILDILAPGDSITSTVPPESDCTGSNEICDDSGYLATQGTSMAAPHAAGAAALIYQYEKLLNKKNATPLEVEGILKKTGKEIIDSGNGLSFPRIDVLAAINSVYKVNDSLDSIQDTDDNAKITFDTDTDLSMASEAFVIRNNFISLDSSRYPDFDKPADLVFYNLAFNKTPVVLKDGTVCLSPECEVTAYDSNLSFSVSGFSNYTSAANSQLEIHDDVDNGITRQTHENITFFANYSNRMSGEPVNGECNITFDDGTDSLMAYNATSELYEYTREYLIADLYDYNITCNSTDYETLSLTDDITVLPGCGLPPPNIDWNMSNCNITCNGENLYFQNQSLIIGPNVTFLLNHSSLVLNQSSVDQEITINETSVLISNYSNITSKVSSKYFYVNVYGKIEMEGGMLNGSNLHVYGSKNNTLRDATSYNEVYLSSSSRNNISGMRLYESVYFQDNTINKINDSVFSGKAYFTSSAVSSIKDSAFDNWLYLRDSSSVNFTMPASNMTSLLIIDLAASSPVIDGYVDMPQLGNEWIQAGSSVKRYYPIQVNYTNTSPVINKLVNITNTSDSVLIWSGYTDANGLADAVLQFASSNYTQNFTISVNPTDNISLLKDTPIQFTLPNLPYCGDGIKNLAEECDGADLGGNSCSSLGYDDGTLGCTVSCIFDSHTCHDHSTGGGSGGGGGGGGDTLCSSKWECSGWSDCTSGKRTRTCTDVNNCGSKDKTEEIKCTEKKVDVNVMSNEPSPAEEDKKPDNDPDDMGDKKTARYENPSLLNFNLWLLIPLIIVVFFTLLPKRVIFAEEDVLKEMIKRDMHREYPRIHIVDEIYQQYAHHDNIKPARYDEKKHKLMMNHLKDKHKIEHEVAKLTAIAHHHLFSTVLTNNEIPEKVRRQFRRIRFYNPLKDIKE